MKFIKLFFCFSIAIILNAQPRADSTLVRTHLNKITNEIGIRNYQNLSALNETADYIHQHFSMYSDSVYYQTYEVNGNEYKNVIATFGPKNAPRLIIGAHYDVTDEQKGADDNASGVVGLLELARMLKNQTLNYRIDLVAYSLEEPPFFGTEHMGSFIHSKYLKDSNIDVYGMISLEMIGYFDESPNSQDYPIGLLSGIYGNKGDFIALINKLGKGQFSREFKRAFNQNTEIRTVNFSAPKSLTGIDWSDHLNYWNAGYSALMITDTSFFRNKNYHEPTDTMETLNIPKMTSVIQSVFNALINL